MNAILIDPFTRSVTEVEYSGDYEEISQLISGHNKNIDAFDVAGLGGRAHIYVDDCGLGGDRNAQAFFSFFSVARPDDALLQPCFGGKALILGSDTGGETVAAHIAVEEVRKRVRWLDNALGAVVAESLLAGG